MPSIIDVRSMWSGETALYIAVEAGETELVQLLVQYKANANIANNEGKKHHWNGQKFNSKRKT